eukprot:484949-Amphidinium_carterae.1
MSRKLEGRRIGSDCMPSQRPANSKNGITKKSKRKPTRSICRIQSEQLYVIKNKEAKISCAEARLPYIGTGWCTLGPPRD